MIPSAVVDYHLEQQRLNQNILDIVHKKMEKEERYGDCALICVLAALDFLFFGVMGVGFSLSTPLIAWICGIFFGFWAIFFGYFAYICAFKWETLPDPKPQEKQT